MKRPWCKRALLLAVCLATAGCGGEDGSKVAAPGGEWVRETSTEGKVTTVRTVNGSVWGGTARLVEEASIGVDAGPEKQMLGRVRSLAASDDAIYVLDSQLPAVRVYDMEGRHLVDIGREGQGPGEFTRPQDLGIGPDGQIFVRERSRIVVFTPEGEPAGTLPLSTGFSSSSPMTVTSEGRVFFPDLMNQGADLEDWQHGMRRVGPDGPTHETVPVPDYDHEPARIIHRTEGGTYSMNVPFAAGVVWAQSPSGAMIAGLTTDFRIDVHHPDGSITRIEKAWDPVPVPPEEKEWRRTATMVSQRRQRPDWTWNGPDIPDVKPAFSTLIPDHSNRIWVRRIADTRRLEDCDEDPRDVEGGRRPRSCWEQVYSVEIFDVEGRYLGSVDVPENAQLAFPRAFIRGDLVVAYHEDELGTPRVKRYRLATPEP